MTTSLESQTVSVRLDADQSDKLNKFVALRKYSGENVTTSDVIRQALDAYLVGAYESLAEAVKEELLAEARLESAPKHRPDRRKGAKKNVGEGVPA